METKIHDGGKQSAGGVKKSVLIIGEMQSLG